MNEYKPPSQPPLTQQTGEQASMLAMVTMVAGLGSWVLLPFFAAVVGFITGWMELSNIRAGRSSEAGKTITQIGFWASAANLALSVGTGCLVAAFYLGFLSLLGLGVVAGN